MKKRKAMGYLVSFSILAVLAAAVCVMAGCSTNARENRYSLAVLEQSGVREVYDVTYTSLAGEPQRLDAYRGKVILIVNVASRCGYTPQYKGLEALYQQNKEKGFVIIGFPCNQFLHQEPGTAEEIAQFCSLNYGVTFPLAAKIDVNGAGKHPLYALFTRADAAFPGKIGWNFTKFLVDRSGTVIARFSSSTKPESAEVTQALESALAAPGN